MAEKIQCIVERAEARDLADIRAVLKRKPALVGLAKNLVARQDALLLAERLLGWDRESIRADLESYPDVDPQNAMYARDLLLRWLKESSNAA